MKGVDSALLTAALFFSAPALGDTTAAAAAEQQSIQIIGKWKVLSLQGVRELSVGDIVEFTTDGRLVTYFKQPLVGEAELQQSFQITGRTLIVPSGKLRVDFRLSNQRLLLTTADGFVNVVMRRAGQVTVG